VGGVSEPLSMVDDREGRVGRAAAREGAVAEAAVGEEAEEG
jgi:hypothetical protein